MNEEQDDALATFVINSHMKNHPEIARATKVEGEIFGEEQKQNKDTAELWLS